MYSLFSTQTFVLSAQKNRLIETVQMSTHNIIETVLLSTHNICFGQEIRKIIFNYELLSRGLPKCEPSPISVLRVKKIGSNREIYFCGRLKVSYCDRSTSAVPKPFLCKTSSEPHNFTGLFPVVSSP